MSQTPFPPQPPQGGNPYAQSPYAPPAHPGGVPPQTGNPLLAPGIILLVLAGLWLLYGIVNAVIAGGQGPPPVPPDAPEGFEIGQNVGFYGAMIGLPTIALFQVIGSIMLIKRKVYGLALTSVILSIIPCCSPVVVLGIPFAIWALVLLLKPEVKAAFS
ncbi:MAG: hypothetical protein AAF958_12400 [Planctomycetota bacterium]